MRHWWPLLLVAAAGCSLKSLDELSRNASAGAGDGGRSSTVGSAGRGGDGAGGSGGLGATGGAASTGGSPSAGMAGAATIGGAAGAAGAAAAPSCQPDGDDADTVLLYDFDKVGAAGSAAVDLTGNLPGTIEGPGAAPDLGPPGCGQALGFGSAAEAYVDVAADPALQLAEGSIDFWLWLERCAPGSRDYGIVSRDASGNGDGHLVSYVDSNCIYNLRFQSPTQSFFIQSKVSLPLRQWVRVGINFGAPQLEMWVDRQLRDWIPVDRGIQGWDGPLVFGAMNSYGEQVRDFLQNGRLDELRISRVRRRYDLEP